MPTLILRPTSDASLGHNCSSGSSGYALVNEASADDDSTYIYQSMTSSNASKTSSFKFTADMPVKKMKITSVKAYVRAKTTSTSSNDSYSLNYTTTMNNKSSSAKSVSLSNSYSTDSNTYTVSTFGLSNVEISDLNNLNIRLSITSSGDYYKNSFQIRITQVYLEITYEEIKTDKFYIKRNGTWQVVKNVYKKINNQYVLQEDLTSIFNTLTKYKEGR